MEHKIQPDLSYNRSENYSSPTLEAQNQSITVIMSTNHGDNTMDTQEPPSWWEQNVPQTNYQCDNCDVILRSETYLQRHMKLRHDDS